VHAEVDEEVSGAGARQQQVAQVGHVGHPLRPGHRAWAVVLPFNDIGMTIKKVCIVPEAGS
jgi:hypothetical protein